MKRTLKYALLASAAALVLGMTAPSQAQQDNMAAPRAASQGAYQAGYDRSGARAATAREDAAAAGGLEAYDYVPAQPGVGGDSCATQGGYSQGTDYANCY